MEHLKAGAAKKCITPPEEMMPARSFLPILLTKVYQDIYVRCLALETDGRKFGIVVFESGDMSRTEELKTVLSEKFGFAKKDLLFTVTHTHEAPSFASEHKEIVKDPPRLEWVIHYGDFVIEKAVECMQEAINKMVPARWGFSFGESYVNVNRDELFEDGHWGQGYDFGGPSDKQLFVMKLIDAEDNTIAVLINYAVHGVVCFFGKSEDGKDYMISGDLPGMTSKYLEERYADEGTIAIWTSGAAGDQNPILYGEYECRNHDSTHYPKYKIGYSCWSLCEHLAQKHAFDIIRLMESMDSFTDRLHISVVDRIVKVPRLKTEEFQEDTLDLVLKLITFNDLAILGIGGEVVCEIGKRLKEISPLRNLVIVEHISERIDYIPDELGFKRRTPEGLNTRIKDGCGEKYISSSMTEMFRERFFD